MASSSPPRFSVVIVARNEAENLPVLLFGLRPFIDRGGEVLLFDTGSNDDTTVIAKDYGCRVEAAGDRFDSSLTASQAVEIEQRFARSGEGPLVTDAERLFHFGNARQAAGLLASNRFVLQLDGCDVVETFDDDEFDRWIDSGDVTAFEYEQIYASVSLRIARFYDKTRYNWEGRVHEILSPIGPTPAPATSKIRCNTDQLRVRHLRDPTKPRPYLAGLALQVLEHPDQPRWWHYLGREFFYNRRYPSAIAAFEQHAAMPDAWKAEHSQSLCFIGECLEALGLDTEAKARYRSAAEIDGSRREPLLRLASLCSRRGEFENAVEYARQSLSIPHTCAYPELAANYTWFPHSVLYWSLFWLGRRDEARIHWDTFRAIDPENHLIERHERLFALGS